MRTTIQDKLFIAAAILTVIGIIAKLGKIAISAGLI